MHVNALGVTPASSSILSPMYEALKAPSPSAIISPACRKILCTVYPAADAPISTSVKLGEVSGVELVSITKRTQQHPWVSCGTTFNSAGHRITDDQMRGMRLCRGSNILRKQLEMRLIFQLGTVQPVGLNINFKDVWTVRALLFTRTHFLLT